MKEIAIELTQFHPIETEFTCKKSGFIFYVFTDSKFDIATTGKYNNGKESRNYSTSISDKCLINSLNGLRNKTCLYHKNKPMECKQTF